jgi:hypothetical protein
LTHFRWGKMSPWKASMTKWTIGERRRDGNR